jgi:predicted RNA methylase
MGFTPHYTRKAKQRRATTARNKATSRRAIDLTALEPLYQGLSGFQASTAGLEGYVTTYGEVIPEGIKAMEEHFTRHTQAPFRTDQRTFYDLGCGIGKVVMGMAMLRPEFRAVGYEIVADRVGAANTALSRVKLRSLSNRCKFVQGSFLDHSVNLGDACWIYISNLCFGTETQQQIVEKLERECRVGCVIACSKDMPFQETARFKKVESGARVPMSWATESTVQIYRCEA